MRSNGYKCYNTDCKYCCGEMCRASADVTLTCIGRIVHKQTNADRIRAMTDEELCDFLYSYKYFDMCEEGCGECRYHGDCERRLADWLKQPHTESEDKDV